MTADITADMTADITADITADMTADMTAFFLLPPVDSNHHSAVQSRMSCHWTRGQSCSPGAMRKLFLHYDRDNFRAHSSPGHFDSGNHNRRQHLRIIEHGVNAG